VRSRISDQFITRFLTIVPRVLCVIALLSAMPTAVPAQDDSPEIRIEKVVTGLRFTEGPAWSPDGFLLFSDTVTNKLHKLVPGQRDSEFAEIPGGPIGNAYDSEGRLYTCEFRERRITRTSKNGKVEVLAGRFEGKRLNAPNDIVVRRDGHVYFTDPAFGNQQDTRELDFYGVFHLTPKGEMEAIAKLKTRPNGLALSPNGRTLYVTDSDAKCVRAYDLGRGGDVDRSGAGGEGRVIVEKIPGVPDGIRADEKGNLWVAANSVLSYSPQGKLLREIALPETPSNLTFGDADLETLFVTARTSVFRVRIGVKGASQN
jgi:gluconolactonase